MPGSNNIWTVCKNSTAAFSAICFASVLSAPHLLASFTASFQPCELPIVAVGDDGVLARCQVQFAGNPGSVELVGRAPNHVREAVFRDRDKKTVQRIAVSARPFIDPENVSIIVRDMNFDGMPDFGLRDFALSGANESWQFWLWDGVRSSFVFHPALSKLPNPEVSTASQVVRSYVVDEHSNITTNTYTWHKGSLVLQGAARETRTDR